MVKGGELGYGERREVIKKKGNVRCVGGWVCFVLWDTGGEVGRTGMKE